MPNSARTILKKALHKGAITPNDYNKVMRNVIPVRCEDCKHRPTDPKGHNYGQDLEFPDDVCTCQVGDNWYSWMPDGNWFCANGEPKEVEDEH